MPDLVAFARSSVRSVLGSASALRNRKLSLQQAKRPEQGVKDFLKLARASENPSSEAPVFIFSAGWRSGSTLLQRLISSAENVLIWGEAYDRANIVQHMTQSLAPFSADWPPRHYVQPPEALGDISQSWVANLYPPPEALLAAHRELLMELFARPAYARGAVRWGFKEVRLGYPEAVLLYGLFPDARFLFIRRELEEAYLSYKSFSARMDWYREWPHKTAFTPHSFARHWARLEREFKEAAAHTGGLLIDYGDLVSGSLDLDVISSHTGLHIDGTVLRNRIGQRETRDKVRLSGIETLLLRRGRA